MTTQCNPVFNIMEYIPFHVFQFLISYFFFLFVFFLVRQHALIAPHSRHTNKCANIGKPSIRFVSRCFAFSTSAHRSAMSLAQWIFGVQFCIDGIYVFALRTTDEYVRYDCCCILKSASLTISHAHTNQMLERN